MIANVDPLVALARRLAVFALFAAIVLPWYSLQDSVFAMRWLAAPGTAEHASLAWQASFHRRGSLLGVLLVVIIGGIWLQLLCSRATRLQARQVRATLSRGLMALGVVGIVCLLGQGFAVSGQPGLGLGAACIAVVFALWFAIGLAARGYFRGDVFIAASLVLVASSIALFTFWPVLTILRSGLQGSNSAFDLAAFWHRVASEKVWGLGCLSASVRCGVAWNTLLLGTLCGVFCTALGLVFALLVTRSDFRGKKILRGLTVLPIITPPFVIGLGMILLFGRSGVVNHWLELLFGIAPSRWIYGLPGVLLAQVFAFTPVAFLILIGVVEGVSPSLEEAASTMRANPRRVFADISLPLMRPGIVNAFLISFIESIADFGNPIVLGGNFGVLSTEIYFSIVGAQLDQGRAAALGMVLLAFAIAAFLMQRRMLGRRSYVAMTGKGDSGLAQKLPTALRRLCTAIALPWVALTVVLYAMALLGGFARVWGRDYSLTLVHYAKAFSIESTAQGLIFTGAAWNSFWTTLQLALIAAPITAALGLVAAYLLSRQRFAGQGLFEFATMLSFAVPGTVIGVSYILAFNVPPVELTGTALILVLCFVFRNMPVGVRAGIAAMSQLDKSLDEASLTLGARGWTTLRRIVLPLMKPAIVAALVYSFVRAAMTVSAVVFLVSAEYEMATTYIINRVVNGDYGVALAYCAVLILVMALAIALIQWLVGARKLGRRATTIAAGPVGQAT